MTSLTGSRRFTRIATLAALAVSIVACGGQAPAPTTSPGVLTGTVSSLTPVTAVAVRDSSAPPLERSAAPAASGTFSVDVNGLTPPFIVKATDAKGGTMFALSPGTGPVSVNVLTTAAVEESSHGGDAEHDWEGSDHHQTVAHVDDLLKQLQTVLAPLLDHYGITGTHDIDESAGFRAMLQEVSFTIDAGVLTIANKATGGIIFTAPLDALGTGVLQPENIPGGTPAQGAACTEFTYSAWGTCQADGTQARTVTSAMPQGCTGGTPVLTQACATTPPPPVATCTSFTYSAWGTCQADGTQARTVTSAMPQGCTGGTPVLTQACATTPPPPVATCTSFTYSAWGTCQADGTQARTVTSAMPQGCTGGTPVLTQSCATTPPPADGATLYAQTCASCHGPLASSDLKGRNISVSLIQSKNMSKGLDAAQLQAIVNAVGP